VIRTVADQFESRRDNFLLVRLVAAALVVFGHCWAIASNPAGEADPIARLTGEFSGTLAVSMFFVISGLLVTQSYARRDDLRGYLRARALRILPALFVCVALTAVVLGPLLTTLPLADYAGHRDTWTYVARNASLVSMQYVLPGVFEGHRTPVVNGSLWSLPAEALMYAMVAAFGVLGALRHVDRFLLLLALSGIALVLGPLAVGKPGLSMYLPFAACFAFGAACWIFRARMPVSGILVLAGVLACIALRHSPLHPAVLGATVAYGTLWLVLLPAPAFLAKVGDYSYGLFLYGYPVQQLVAHALPQAGPWTMLALALPIALGCAALSWHLVEKPALRLK